MDRSALVFCENEFGKIDGKVANGLVRKSDKYKILGIIDSTKAGLDAGDILDSVENGIPVFASLDEALEKLGIVPEYFIQAASAVRDGRSAARTRTRTLRAADDGGSSGRVGDRIHYP